MATQKPDFMLVESTRTWIDAVVFQGERLIAMRKARLEEDEWRQQGDNWRAPRKTDRVPVEDQFFLTAAAKSVRWLEKLAKAVPTARDVYNGYVLATGGAPAKDVRDMREHDDEYLTGKGRARQRNDFADSDGNVMDASSSSTSGDEINLGGRVDVAACMTAAADVLAWLNKIYPDGWNIERIKF